MTEQEYLDSKLTFNKKGIFLGKENIMWEYEKVWIKKQVRGLFNKHQPDSILEIGFGLGHTADEFQRLGVKRHVIVEPHPEIYKRALAWGKTEIINDFIQNLELDEEFNMIYDDRAEFVFNDFDLSKIKHKYYERWQPWQQH